MNRKLPLILLALILIISFSISLIPILSGIFPVTFDQGRDFLWVQNQLAFKTPSLVGPWGSLKGVFFGPLWFWLLAIPFWFSNGSPIAMTIFNSLIVFSSVILASILFYKQNKLLSFFILLLGFTSPAIQNLAHYAFSQHLLPILTILLVYSLTKIIQRGSQPHFILNCLWLGLIFHSEPPMTVFSFPSLIIATWITYKNKRPIFFKTIILGIVVFVTTFLPLIVFDFRHDFIQSRAILEYLLGNNKSLQEIAAMSFGKRLIDRPVKFLSVLQSSVANLSTVAAIFSWGIIIYLIKKYPIKKSISSFFKTSLIYLGSLLVIAIIYPDDFKPFYLEGINLIFIIWASFSIVILYQKLKHQKLVYSILIFLFIFNLKPVRFVKSLTNNFEDRHALGSLYLNQTKALDWIYQDANGQGFKVYTFVPPTYDYNYQYAFFYYGLNQYGYLPTEFSYAPNKPEYVPKKQLLLSKLENKIKSADDLVYLIITKGSREEISGWYDGLKSLKLTLIQEQKLLDGTIVQRHQLLK